jgi:ribonuclease G
LAVTSALFIAVSPGEIWAALEEEGALAALRVLRPDTGSRIGEILLGRVLALRPELPAAFVELGLDRPGFLDARDADRRTGLAGLTEGAAIIVEVMKEARADKAVGLRVPRLGAERRARLEAAARATKPPARLETPPSPLAALLGEFLKPPPDRIVIDDRLALAEARSVLAARAPALCDRLSLHNETAPLFEAAGLAGAIEAALGTSVPLQGGGALHVETTRAATLIDVDGGGKGALAVNLEAARATARQIRLRNIAGPIVIDFIGMKRRGERDKVLGELQMALSGDPEKPELLGWTRLGHVELVRRRRRPALAEILFEPAPGGALRKTALTVALEALRAAEREARAQPGRALVVAAHPDIVAALASGAARPARLALEARLGRALGLEPEPARAREGFEIAAR